MAPRWPKMAPRWPQDGPKRPQDEVRMGPKIIKNPRGNNDLGEGLVGKEGRRRGKGGNGARERRAEGENGEGRGGKEGGGGFVQFGGGAKRGGVCPPPRTSPPEIETEIETDVEAEIETDVETEVVRLFNRYAHSAEPTPKICASVDWLFCRFVASSLAVCSDCLSYGFFGTHVST